MTKCSFELMKLRFKRSDYHFLGDNMKNTF